MYKRIGDLRQDKDLKQKQIAEYLSVAQTTYSDYELGKLNIPIPTLIKLAEYHDTSIDYLVGITDEKNPYPKAKKYIF